jgi:TetR/AcrR family transcriptional regulator, transcriptional repressor for nem operon
MIIVSKPKTYKKSKVKERVLLREGYRLMRSLGYQNTSVDQVVSNLNIPKGTFYYYFKSKEEFAEAVLVYYITIVLNRIDRVLYDYALSPRQRLIKLYSDYIDLYTNSDGPVYGNFASTIFQELGSINASINEKVTMFYNRTKDAHIDCLQSARRAGEINKSQDPEKLAMLIIYSWEGAILRVNNTGNIRSLFAFRELLRDFILS